jgi:hypothetical protein
MNQLLPSLGKKKKKKEKAVSSETLAGLTLPNYIVARLTRLILITVCLNRLFWVKDQRPEIDVPAMDSFRRVLSALFVLCAQPRDHMQMTIFASSARNGFHLNDSPEFISG